jgi:3-isopropylmalate dehydrogenase
MVRYPLDVLSLLLAAPTAAFQPRATAPARHAISLAALSKKGTVAITLLPGNGIGPKITAATKVALAALCEKRGFKLDLKEALIDSAAIDAVNDPFPKETFEQCQASDSVFLVCIIRVK